MDSKLKIASCDEKDQIFTVSTSSGNTVRIADTFAEMFTMMGMSPAIRHHMTVFFTTR